MGSGKESFPLPVTDKQRFFNMVKWRNGRLFCRSGDGIYAWDSELSRWELWLSPEKRFMSYEIGPDGSVLLIGPMAMTEKASINWLFGPLRLLKKKGIFLELYAPHAKDPKWTEEVPDEVAAAGATIPNIHGFDHSWSLGDHTLIYSSHAGFLFQFTWTGRKLRELTPPWPKLDDKTLQPVREFQRKGTGRFKEIHLVREGFLDMDLYLCPAGPFQTVLAFRKHFHSLVSMDNARAKMAGTEQALIQVGEIPRTDHDLSPEGWNLATLDLETGDISPLNSVSGDVVEGYWYAPDGRGMPLAKLIENISPKAKTSPAGEAQPKPQVPLRPVVPAPPMGIAPPPEGWEEVKIVPRQEAPPPKKAPNPLRAKG